MTKRKSAKRRHSGAESRQLPLRLVAALILILLSAGLYLSRMGGARRTAGHVSATNPAIGINTPLAKEYIYAGGRLVAIEEAGGASRSPYPGNVPHAVPGLIEAEDFDEGGEGLTYHDADPLVNLMGAYRSSGVDIEACGAPGSGCGFNVGNTWQGEWLEYTINVTSAGVYDLEIQVASGNGGGGTFHVTVDGADVTGALRVPATGGWQTYQPVRKMGVTLNSGLHVLRLALDTEGPNRGVANFDFIRVTVPGAAQAPSKLLATFQPATAQVSVTWSAPSGDVDHYEVERRVSLNDQSPYLFTCPATPCKDTAAAPSKAYLYRVRAVFLGGSKSDYSTLDLAATFPFTDDPLGKDGPKTVIKAQHFTELRNAINAVRAAAEQTPFEWSGTAPRSLGPLSLGLIYASHFNDLRAGLSEALGKLGLPTPQSAQVNNGDPVNYSPMQELRELVR